MLEERYAARPFVHSRHHQTPDHYGTHNAPYDGLQPLGIDSYDWEEEK